MEALRFALLGLGLGAAYVLIGQGIVLVYRGSGLLNFAQGGVAMIVAQMFYGLRDDLGLATPVALVAALVAAGLIGASMQLLVLQHLREASGLVRVIATLGLLIIIQGVGVVAWGASARPVDGLLPTGIADLGNGLLIGIDRLFLLAICVVLTAGLWVVYQRTRYGLATSAVAENQQAAVTLGWSPGAIATGNWVAGSVLAGVAGILLAPVVGLSVTTLVLAVIPGLAAALVGRFASFWLTLVGGLGIGVVQGVMARFVELPGWADAVPFVVIIALVVLRGSALPLRGEFTDRSVRVGSGRIRPWLLAVVLLCGAVVLGALRGGWLLAVTTTALAGLVALSLVLVTGYAGQISLAQLTLAGVGAITAANVSAHLGMPFAVAVLLGAATAAAFGVLVALPALRCRGVNLAVVTIGLGLVVEALVLRHPVLSGGAGGLAVPAPSLLGIDLQSLREPARYAGLVCLLFTVCALVVANIRRGATGRRLLAVRSNERAAVSSGVNVLGAKLYAFGVGAAIAGIGGAVAAFQFPRLNLVQYSSLESITLLVQTVVGGLGFVGGAIFGGVGSPSGVFPEALSHLDPELTSYVAVVSGVLVLATLVANPHGISEALCRLRPIRRIMDRIGHRHAEPDPVIAAPGTEEDRPQVGRELSVRGLEVDFGGVRALRKVDFDVRPGEVVGLIGPNGAGKTTLIDAVTGLVPSHGTITLGDIRLHGLSPRRRVRAGLGRTFQGVELFDDLSCADNIRVAAESGDGGAYLRDVIRPRTRPPLAPEVAGVVRELDLVDALDKLPAELSMGTRRLVGVARTLAGAPGVVLLDEPASGLDDTETRELGHVIHQLAERRGLAVLLVEHDIDLVRQVSDRVVALALGQVIATGPPDEVLAHPDVVTAYLGEESRNRTSVDPRNPDRDTRSPALAEPKSAG